MDHKIHFLSCGEGTGRMLVLRRARSRKLQPSKNISPSLGPLIQWSVSIESNFQYCPIAMRARRCVVGRWSFVRDAWPPNVHMYTHVTHNVTRYPLHVTRYADVIVHVWDGYTYVSIKSISLLTRFRQRAIEFVLSIVRPYANLNSKQGTSRPAMNLLDWESTCWTI